MLELKNIFLMVALLVCATGSSSCARKADSSGNRSASPLSGALPEAWYTLPETRAVPVESTLVQPDQGADSAVRNSFSAYTSAFSALALPPGEGFPSVLSEKSSRVPWHLDGLIADFAISTNGIFGAHLFNGTYALRAAWRRQGSASLVKNSQAQQRKSVMTVGPQTTASDASAQLEPVIRATMAAGLVLPQYESIFRVNLLRQGERFRNLCHMLSSIGFDSGWTVDGFQLQLSFNASGQLTPAIGVGGAFNLFFDWQKAGGEPPLVEATPLSDELNQFTHLIAGEISQALAETPEVKDSGLRLQQVQFGLGLSAGGSIGIARAQAGIQGKIVFKRDAAPHSKIAVVVQRQDAEFINLIRASVKPEHLAYATKNGIPFQRFQSASRPDEIVYQIQRDRFRNGLKHAFKIASYFGKKAIEADTKKWKLTEIETELDISLGGEFALTVVNGTGQVALDFDRPEANVN